jgi:hypothetical protein
MARGLIECASADSCTVDLTPRRVQRFKPAPGTQVRWTNRSLAASTVVDRGTAEVDALGLLTLLALTVGKGLNRIAITRRTERHYGRWAIGLQRNRQGRQRGIKTSWGIPPSKDTCRSRASRV